MRLAFLMLGACLLSGCLQGVSILRYPLNEAATEDSREPYRVL